MTPALYLHLDRRPACYTAGEALSGTAEVRLDGAPLPQHLLLKLWWAARGADSALDHRVHVEETRLPVSGDGSLPFTFPLPREPLSWSGRSVSLTWTLTARLQWEDGREDLVDSLDLVLLPGPLPAAALARHSTRGGRDRARIGRSEAARLLLRSAILGLAGLTQTALCAGAVASRSSVAIIGVGVFSVLVTLGGAAVAISTLRELRRTFLGPAIKVDGLPRVLTLGQPFELRIGGPGFLRWELQWTERSARDLMRGPTGRAIRSREWPQTPVAVASGEAESGSTLFLQIPNEAPASFSCPTRRIDWQLLVWEGEEPVAFPLTVAPARFA